MSQLDTLISALGNARDALLTASTWSGADPISSSFLEECADAASRTIGSIQTEIDPAANEHCPGTLALADGGLTLRLFEGHKLVGEHRGRRYAPAAGAVLIEDNGAQWQVTDAPLTMALQGDNVVSVSVVNVVNVTVTKIAWEF